MVISTTTIIKAYEADQAAADARYQGKTLRMTGKVTNINDVFDVKALMLRDSENDTGLQCYLTDSADAQKVSIGQTITIEGNQAGAQLGTAVSGGGIWNSGMATVNNSIASPTCVTRARTRS